MPWESPTLAADAGPPGQARNWAGRALDRHARPAGGDDLRRAVRRQPDLEVRAAGDPVDRPAADHRQPRAAWLGVRRDHPVPRPLPDRSLVSGRRHRHERRGRSHRTGRRAPHHEHLPRMLERGLGGRRRHAPPSSPRPACRRAGISSSSRSSCCRSRYGVPRALPEVGRRASAGRAAFTLPSRGILGLCLFLFGMLMVEVAARNWGAVYVSDELDGATVYAGLTYSAFALFMAVGRFLGDRTVERFGPVAGRPGKRAARFRRAAPGRARRLADPGGDRLRRRRPRDRDLVSRWPSPPPPAAATCRRPSMSRHSR